MQGHVAVIGTGLVGGSVGLGLTRAGFEVVAYDAQGARLDAAVERGAASRAAATVAAACEGAGVAIVAVPVGSVAGVAAEALGCGAGVVSDVGSVKGSVVRAVEAAAGEGSSRFVGGHPMAGSEQEGIEGADPDLFRGATWVLTPTARTDPSAFTTLRAVIGELGAEVVAVEPDQHDRLVAVVSHVPHLTAGTLMLLAQRESADGRTALSRLAAGGFRDMTRIASGHPGIWPDICVENREAIVAAMDGLLEALTEMRSRVASADRDGLLEALESAREARGNLPIAHLDEGPFVELRVPVPDRPGVLAEVTTLAGQLGVNIADLEIAHSAEGPEGVIVMVVPEAGAGSLEAGLADLGYRTSRRGLT